MFVAFEARDVLFPACSYVPFPEPVAVHQQAQSANIFLILRLAKVSV